MTGVLFIRTDDHLVLGVRWSGFTISGTGAATVLTAGAQSRLVLVLPPQHIGEEASPPGSAAPAQLPTDTGATVPVWSGILSAPTRLAFAFAAGTRIPLTAAGVLAAVLDIPLLVPAGAPGPDDTAIELPWRLIIAPSGASGTVCRHAAQPVSADSSGLWRTRIVDPHGANLTLRVADKTVADAADPVFQAGNALPLAHADRQRLFLETITQPARLARLELSPLGGTLDATGVFPNFEWEHRASLGRDMHVRTLASGVLYPLGHRAEFVKTTERVYDPAAGGAAVLRTIRILTVVEPVRHAPGAGPIRRAFPLGDIEITRTVFRDLAEAVPQTTTLPGVGAVGTHFWPTTLSGTKVLFPVACTTASGVVRMEMPLLFVFDLRPAVDSLASPVLAQRLTTDYGETEVEIAPTTIDLTGAVAGPIAPAAADPNAAAFHEVRKLKIGGATLGEGLDLANGYRSKLTELEIGLPALRALRGQDSRAAVTFAKNYLRDGVSDVLLEMVPADSVPIDFTAATDRSGGLLAPKYLANAISRSMGPIDKLALPDPGTGFIDPARLFPSDAATLLGFPLKSLLTQLKLPPQITVTPTLGQAPEVRMRWQGIALTSMGPFRATPNVTKLDLTIVAAPGKAETICVINDFTLELPPRPKSVLRLSFKQMTFHQQGGNAPRLDVSGVKAEFSGDLTLLKDLAKACDLDKAGRLIDVRSTGLSVHYSLPIPSIATGAFTMRNMAFSAGIEIPFDGRPMSILLGFSSRVSPFQLGIMMFGGGGYIELALDRQGLQRFEASLEFGAFVAVDFVVARGEVHALGGVRFLLEHDGTVTITGYLRIGGSVNVLGLISVSIELCLSMAYQSQRNALVGRATLVIEIDLTLWSDSVELDSGEWVLAGGTASPRGPQLPAFDGLSQWRTYRAAFAQVE
ncbi:hypothetical protein ACFXPR_15630 [Nocardia tengchongensis]|uniref:hypothetical protein n=1 Tax=Nocardia tengchongensis TaxID=2055889 RepID=UPI00367F2DE0